MIGWASQWTWTRSITPLQPKNKMLIFVLSSTSDDWLGWSMDLPPLSSQKNKMLIFGLHSTSDDRLGWLIDSNPVCHPSPVKEIKCLFLDYIQLPMISQNGLEIHLPPLCSQKIKCMFLDYVQLLMIGWAGRSIQNPSATHLQPKNKMLIFGLHSTSDDRPGGSMDSNPIHHTFSSKKKLNACFWIMFNFWWLAGLVDWFKTHLLPISSQKIKCSFLDYVQLLMIGRASHWTQTPAATPLQSKK